MTATGYRPPYLAATIAGVAVWLLYVITLSPTTWFWDTSEYIATAHILGIPHPPGNPLFVVIARAWELLLAPTALSTAIRINLFSATMSALAHGCWFLVAHRILAFYSDRRWFRTVGAAAAVAISATAFTVWNQSNVNEKVYTVSLFTIALLSWLAFLWRENLDDGNDDNLIILAIYILALSVGNHLMAFLVAPSLLVFVLMVRPRALTNWKLYVAAAVATVIGLSIHLYLPIRAVLDPVLNEADPSTMQALVDALTRQQYSKPSIFTDPTAPPGTELPRTIGLVIAQIGHYLQYFDWQWARSVAGNVAFFGGLRPVFTVVFALLGLYGAYTNWQRDRATAAFMAILFATLSLGLVIYLNFRYGYTYAIDAPQEMREVRERDYFFIVGFSVWGVWAGIGLAAVWQRLAEDLSGRLAAARAYAVTAPVLVLALIPLALNWTWASRSGDYSARDWAYNMLQSVEPYGVLFTNGDNDTFPLWYLQEVEGIRRDVTVIVTSYLNTPWYVKQLAQLTTPCPEGVDPMETPTLIVCQRPYDGDGPAFYEQEGEGEQEGAIGRDSLAGPGTYAAAPGDVPGTEADDGGAPVPVPGGAPTRSILPLTEAEIDRIASTVPFATNQDLTFSAGNVQTVLPRGTVMIPADVFMTAILTTALGDRPIYYASTTQSYNDLNLAPYLMRQGVAYKVYNGPAEPDALPGVYAVPDSPYAPILGYYFDLARTEKLLWDVYIHRSGIPDEWDHWVDPATQNIPYYYGITHLGAYQINLMLGRIELAERHLERAQAWLGLTER